MKKILCLMHFMLLVFLNAASIKVNDKNVFVDTNKKIILINENIDQFNSTFDQISKLIISDNEYVLNEKVEEFNIGTSYSAFIDDEEYLLYFTTLPIINIDVENTIVNTPKVLGNFTLITLDGEEIKSKIGVEYRGASSQAYPKKSMEIEFWEDDEGENTIDFSLLGLRETDSYNLQAVYNEPLRVNSKLSNDLWRQIHTVHYQDKEPEAKNGISMEFVEVFINREYKGVYALGEKVGRGQLKLKKYKDGEIKGELYKGDEVGGTTFTKIFDYDNMSDVWNGFEYKHPKEEINWENIYNLVDFVINANDEVFFNEYSDKFEVDNIVDYFIFLNLSRATDNTGKNLYFAKYDEKGKYFFVPWDLDGTFGFNWDASRGDIVKDILFNGLYSRLWEDIIFREKLSKRWKELRVDIITRDNILGMFEKNLSYLHANKVYERESFAWDYNFEQDNFDYVRGWLERRIAFLDVEFTKVLSVDNLVIDDNKIQIYPNPITSSFSISTKEIKKSNIKIIDFSGKIVQEVNNYKSGDIIFVEALNKGVYFVVVENHDSIRTSRLIIK